MLCVSKVRTGGHAYYLEVVDTGVEAPGEWLSAGADLLELRGKVAAGDLEAVLAGLDPSSGKRLGRSHDRVKVAGFDLTFCAPKSVSLLHTLGAPDVSAEVRSGHNEAVKEALSYVERRALAVRRGSGAHRIPLPVDGVAAGGFVHRTSRALDPHLHTGLGDRAAGNVRQLILWRRVASCMRRAGRPIATCTAGPGVRAT